MPEALAQFVAADQFAWTLQQKCENGDGLALQLKLGAVLVYLGPGHVSSTACTSNPIDAHRSKLVERIVVTSTGK